MTNRVEAVLLAAALFFSSGLRPQGAFSAEPICPGGSNPRADMIWCSDFSNLTNCRTGREPQCWIDNGFSQGGTSNLYVIKSGDGPTTTRTAAVGVTPPGSNGLGWAEQPFPSRISSVSLRWYLKFDHGFMHPYYEAMHHGPAVEMDNGGGCLAHLSLDYNGTYGIGWVSENSGCGPESAHFSGNLAPISLQDNMWHIVEMQIVLDTACTDPTQLHGCNGIWRTWFDGVQNMEYTDFNFRKADPNVTIWGVWIPRAEYGPGSQTWGQRELYANIAVSNGAYIGRAANEIPLGTPDPASPYVSYATYDAQAGLEPNGACDISPGYLGYTKISAQWRNGATLQSAVTHGLYTGSCISQDKALQVQLTGPASGGGQSFERGDQSPQLAIHGWIYPPSGNDYSQPPALSGFSRYGSDGTNWSQYVALTVSNGQWGILQRPDAGTPQVVARAGTVTFNAWHEFELIIFKNDAASLMIDKQQIIGATALPMTAGWFWDASGGNLWQSKIVVGVIDYRGQASASAPFTVVYDDMDEASVSFWNCTGWGAASCPFGAAPPPGNTIAPAAPRGVRVL